MHNTSNWDERAVVDLQKPTRLLALYHDTSMSVNVVLTV
jgi:hypothetical protein